MMNFFPKRSILLLLTAMLCGHVLGAERSEDEMLQIAAQVLHKYADARLSAHRATGTSSGVRVLRRMSMLSVVGTEQTGFVLVSHDDRVRAVLGYSHINPQPKMADAPYTTDLPCGLEWYLESLDASLQAMADDGYEWAPIDIRPDESLKPQVEPLLQTDWYQGTPFNDWCPTYTDSKGQVRHHVVGCSATATTQVMYYHRHPEVGCGETSYTYNSKQHFGKTDLPYEEELHSLSCRFDTVHFNWDAMQTKYDKKRSNNEKANEEAARLCMAVGIGLKMIYTETDGSGNGNSPGNTLRENFRYSTDMRGLLRKNYSDEIWMQMIFGQLSNGRPVIYSGTPHPDKAGHMFVIDGYDADGLVHVNWGWGNNAKYDGYFDLNYLRPNNNNTHYSTEQTMTIDIRPDGMPIEMLELTVTQPGSLAAMLPAGRSLRLKIAGTLGRADLQALRDLGTGVKDADGRIKAELTHLDLSGATLPDNALPDSAFCDCRQLLQLELPSTLQHIGNQAFRNCLALKKLHLPSTVSRIDKLAFLNCVNLTTLTMPRSLSSLDPQAFGGTIRLESFGVEDGNRHFATTDGILTDATGHKLVAYPEARPEAAIPETVDSIGPFAFYYCTKLKEVHVPRNVKVICNYAFYVCHGLKEATLDEGVQRILANAFYGCDSLQALSLPATIDSLGRRLFVDCTSLRQVTMSDQNPHFRIENNCLLSRDGKKLVQALLTEAETVDIPASVESIENAAFYSSKVTRLRLPSTIRKVDRESIYFCKQLTRIDMEEGIEEIAAYAFNGCSALTEMHLPASLKTIGTAIFVNCTGLTQVDISKESTLFSTSNNMLFSKDGTRLLQQLTDDKEEYVVPETVTAIGSGCFRYLLNLRRLTIPVSVSSIGSYVLYGCNPVPDVCCLSPTPLRLSQYVFAQTDLSQATLHVPAGCRQAYLSMPGWKDFGNIVDDLTYNAPEAKYYRYDKTLKIERSNPSTTRLVIVSPCPQSNQYQEVHAMDHTSKGNWTLRSIEENQNQYLELDLNSSDLQSQSQNFNVGFSFVLSHKSIYTDFSSLKNTDGTWKPMPAYDTTTQDYRDNTKQSGDYVVPGNSTIRTTADQLLSECDGNLLAYAERCHEYVAYNYKYMNPGTGLHTLATILADGGGDCGNLSSIYISLLRAKGIPARHVVAIGDGELASGAHVWSEFYVQDFGWIPVDVSHKNGNPSGNYFGVYTDKYVVVQRGVAMDYPVAGVGTKNFNILQGFKYWYWNGALTITREITCEETDASATGIQENGLTGNKTGQPRKMLKNGRVVIVRGARVYNIAGIAL